MDYNGFIQFLKEVVGSFFNIGDWLTTPIGIGDWQVSPLILISFGGLTVFIGIAVVKWVIS